MRRDRIFQCFRSDSDNNLEQKEGGSSSKCLFFKGNDKNRNENGKILLEERITLFDGRTNPIQCFSVDDLNSMNVNMDPVVQGGFLDTYSGVWDGNLVLVKICSKELRKQACREIAVATQMGTHSNAHRLLGFCLVTDYPVLVYEWADNGSLDDRILKYKEQSKEALKWKDRLRIAWEIAHAVAYLHTAFRLPIIHRNLKPKNVYLDQDDSARLSDFSFAISIPKGKKHVEDVVMGTVGYLAPKYHKFGRVMESADVYSFGVLLLLLLTGKSTSFSCELDPDGVYLVSWVRDCHAANNLGDIVDPAISTDGTVADEHFDNHLQELVKLALRCLSEEEEYRPTMVEVATELKDMIMLSSHSLYYDADDFFSVTPDTS